MPNLLYMTARTTNVLPMRFQPLHVCVDCPPSRFSLMDQKLHSRMTGFVRRGRSFADPSMTGSGRQLPGDLGTKLPIATANRNGRFSRERPFLTRRRWGRLQLGSRKSSFKLTVCLKEIWKFSRDGWTESSIAAQPTAAQSHLLL